MKNRCILLALSLLVMLAAPAWAAGPLVVDDAALLTPEAARQLSEEASRISDAYEMDVVLLTTGSLGGQAPRDFAADYFDYNGYGRGADHDGVLLLMSIVDRETYILTTGRGIDAFTDYAIETTLDDIVPYFSGGDYAGGFGRFLRDAEIVLKQARSGRPYDWKNPMKLQSPLERAVGAAGYLAIAALVVAAAALGIMIFAMKTARPRHSAEFYVKDGSLQITRAQDIYLYRTQTRVRVQSDSSSGSRGGSSTFRSSSGRSHGGGGRKF